MPAGSASQSDLRSQYISRNPFTPIFGQVPPYFAGRENIIDAWHVCSTALARRVRAFLLP